MGSIQSSTMILCALGNRSASFYPEGRTYSPPRRNRLHITRSAFWAELTHSVVLPLPKKSCDFPGPLSAVVFPTENVRSPRGMRLLRKPDGQCHIDEPLLPLSTQLVCGKRSQNTVALTDGIPPTARTNLPPAALNAAMTLSSA